MECLQKDLCEDREPRESALVTRYPVGALRLSNLTPAPVASASGRLMHTLTPEREHGWKCTCGRAQRWMRSGSPWPLPVTSVLVLASQASQHASV